MHQNYTRGPFVTLFYPWVIFNCPLKALLFTQFCAESAHFWHCSIKPEVIEELKTQTQKEFDIVNLFQPLGSQKCQYEGVPPTLQSAPSTFWGAFGTVINILGPPW